MLVDESRPWGDPGLPVDVRVDMLLSRMTLAEKLAQLVGLWVGADASGGGVAPHQADMTDAALSWPEVIAHGLGQLTRPFGTAPVDSVSGARSLAASQRQVAAANRFGIPALVHEECLAGLAAWGATAFPVPLSWGASFDPDLVERMSAHIGASMAAAGVHQGLAPVLDVTVDYRWGRTEETIGEDPYLVGTVGAAYVRGLQSAGVVATLKHFAGYSVSRAGRNLAPVSLGRRELADVVLPPFEHALRDGGARSVMHSYASVDGVPAAADRWLLTELLRDDWGFDGTVVADYFGIPFLHAQHRVAVDEAQAAVLALSAGVDVELPTVRAYGAPLREAVQHGDVDEALVDRAVRRVLAQKIELGLLDDGWDPLPAEVEQLSLDDDEGRSLALRLAREAVVLVANRADGVGGLPALPLRTGARLAVVGPLADDPMAMLGCYSFPAHVGVRHPDVPMGIDIVTVLAALRERADVVATASGCDVTDPDRSGIAAAAQAAAAADVAVVVVGDRAGLFGRGTSGEGCDATDLELPGVQSDLVRAVLDTGRPTVLLLLTGRPYALGDLATRSAAVVQAFFPGQRGGEAIAEILTGAVNPSGRLPVSLPGSPSGQPGTYLAAPLGQRSAVSSTDPTPAYPFGHGLSYTTFEWSDAVVEDQLAEEPGPDAPAVWSVDGELSLAVTVTNTGLCTGTEVVQLYLHDAAAQVVQPDERLVGYARAELEPGASARVRWVVPADLAAFTGLAGRRVVEPGDVELRLGRSSSDIVATLRARLVGPVREVGHDRQLRSRVTVTPGRSVLDDELEVMAG